MKLAVLRGGCYLDFWWLRQSDGCGLSEGDTFMMD